MDLLLAVELFAMTKKTFSLELPLALLFNAPTIHDLASRFDAELYLAGAESNRINNNGVGFNLIITDLGESG